MVLGFVFGNIWFEVEVVIMVFDGVSDTIWILDVSCWLKFELNIFDCEFLLFNSLGEFEFVFSLVKSELKFSLLLNWL